MSNVFYTGNEAQIPCLKFSMLKLGLTPGERLEIEVNSVSHRVESTEPLKVVQIINPQVRDKGTVFQLSPRVLTAGKLPPHLTAGKLFQGGFDS